LPVHRPEPGSGWRHCRVIGSSHRRRRWRREVSRHPGCLRRNCRHPCGYRCGKDWRFRRNGLKIPAGQRETNPVLDRLLNSSGSHTVPFSEPSRRPATNEIEFHQTPLNFRSELGWKYRHRYWKAYPVGLNSLPDLIDSGPIVQCLRKFLYEHRFPQE
jgi:hypothetical protein